MLDLTGGDCSCEGEKTKFAVFFSQGKIPNSSLSSPFLFSPKAVSREKWLKNYHQNA